LVQSDSKGDRRRRGLFQLYDPDASNFDLPGNVWGALSDEKFLVGGQRGVIIGYQASTGSNKPERDIRFSASRTAK
jgi:hypothetical protein